MREEEIGPQNRDREGGISEEVIRKNGVGEKGNSFFRKELDLGFVHWVEREVHWICDLARALARVLFVLAFAIWLVNWRGCGCCTGKNRNCNFELNVARVTVTVHFLTSHSQCVKVTIEAELWTLLT